jgi:hypothetical protein
MCKFLLACPYRRAFTSQGTRHYIIRRIIGFPSSNASIDLATYNHSAVVINTADSAPSEPQARTADREKAHISLLGHN